jgi:hypothetical protein
MAITTLAGAVAGALPPMPFAKVTSGSAGAGGAWLSQWLQAGDPVLGVASSAGMAGEALTAPVTGALRFQNPASGNSYLLNAGATSVGTTQTQAVLCDRLWQQSGIDVTVTTAQTINSVAWPARDMNGATDGAGVWIALEVMVNTGAGGATPVIEYTNSANAGTRTGTCLRYTASAQAGRICFFDLAAGDVGVRSVQSITLGTSLTSGTVNLVALRPICYIPCPITTPFYNRPIDAFSAGFARVYDNSVLQPIILGNAGAAFGNMGQYTVAQG